MVNSSCILKTTCLYRQHFVPLVRARLLISAWRRPEDEKRPSAFFQRLAPSIRNSTIVLCGRLRSDRGRIVQEEVARAAKRVIWISHLGCRWSAGWAVLPGMIVASAGAVTSGSMQSGAHVMVMPE